MANYTGALVTAPATLAASYDPPVASLVYIGAPSNFAQRVWSTGTSVWCYYTGVINASPSATATTPNWVTSAIRHEVLGPV